MSYKLTLEKSEMWQFQTPSRTKQRRMPWVCISAMPDTGHPVNTGCTVVGQVVYIRRRLHVAHSMELWRCHLPGFEGRLQVRILRFFYG